MNLGTNLAVRDVSGTVVPGRHSLSRRTVDVPETVRIISPELFGDPDRITLIKQEIYPTNYLTETELNNLYQRTIKAKKEIDNLREQTENKKITDIPNGDLHAVIKRNFTKTPSDPKTEYLDHPLIKEFVSSSKSGLDSIRMRSLSDALQTNFVIGFFQLPYNKFLVEPSLEFVAFKRKDLPLALRTTLPSHAAAVEIIKSTAAYSNPFIDVARFPEAYCRGEGNQVHENDPLSEAVYHIDKFLTRIYAYTLFALQNNTDKNSFRKLKNASKDELFRAASAWLSVHEFFHATGHIPRVKRWPLATNDAQTEINSCYGFDLKDSRTGGAFEELRVDVKGILNASIIAADKGYGDLADLVQELILAERLIRYPIQRNPDKDFDSMTSHVLLNWLYDKQAIDITGSGETQKISIPDTKKLLDSLKSLNQAIEDIEQQVAFNIDGSPKRLQDLGNREVGKTLIKNFMEEWAYKHSDGEKTLHPFYQLLRNNRKHENLVQDFLRTFVVSKPWKYLRPVQRSFFLKESKLQTPTKKRKPGDAAKDHLGHNPKTVFWICDSAKDIDALKIRSELALTSEPKRNEVDTALLEYLEKKAQQSQRSSSGQLTPLESLMHWSQINIFDEKNKNLIYYGYEYDYKNRLDAESLKRYTRLIINDYARNLSGKGSLDPNVFALLARRVIRAKIHKAIYDDPTNPSKPNIDIDESLRTLVRNREEDEQMNRRNTLITIGAAAVLATTTATARAMWWSDKQKTISLDSPHCLSQPKSLDDFDGSLEGGYKLDSSSRIFLASQVLPLLVDLFKKETGLTKANLSVSLPGTGLNRASILISGKNGFYNITIPYPVRKKIFEIFANKPSGNTNQSQLLDFIKQNTQIVIEKDKP